VTAHSVLGPFSTAAYARITGDVPFMALIKGVFDDVPEGENFPYVSFGEATENSWDCFGQDGVDAVINLHVWSRYRGFSEAQGINNALIGLLDNDVGLSIAGYATVLLNYDSSQQLRDPDGITRHIVTRFRVMADVT
jgi:hypothetical protein